MHGSSAGLLHELFTRNGVLCEEIRVAVTRASAVRIPSPSSRTFSHCATPCLAGKYDAGFCADGDGDRIGAIDRDGRSLIHTNFLRCWSGILYAPAISRATSPRPSR